MGGSSSKEFKIQDIPDLSSKVILVTGGNAGIGRAISKVFASAMTHAPRKEPYNIIICSLRGVWAVSGGVLRILYNH